MKSTKDSTSETQGGWNTFGMNVQRWPTEEYVQSARIKKRRRREEHVLDILAAQHVPVDRYVCHVAEIA